MHVIPRRLKALRHRVPASHATTPTLAAVAAELGSLTPNRVLLWTGAGISVPGPSSLPTGWELTERLFRSFFQSDALAIVLGYHTRAYWLTSALCPVQAVSPTARLPRLETVLGVAERYYGTRAHGVLDDVRTAAPNAYHEFFACHIAAGGRHITANFDICIERAQASSGAAPPAADALIHFHERLDATTTAATLGATLARIEGGFSTDLATRMLDRVTNAAATVLFGYSGSDFFDVDVTFSTLQPGSLDGHRVYWIWHSEKCSWHELHPDAQDEPPLARYMRAAGAEVRHYCGPTGTLLQALAGHWRMPYTTDSAARGLKQITVATSDDEKTAATLALYRELGIPAEIDRMLALSNPAADPKDLWMARSELMWEQGRWNQLRRMWYHGPLPPGVSEATRLERIGAALWVQGRLVPAYLWLSHHRRRLEAQGQVDEAWPLAETQARVVEHMGLTPELRPLGRRLARKAAERLGSPDQTKGVHTYRRHYDLQTSLSATARGVRRNTDDADTSRQWFEQAGSMIAAIAYSHRMLRDGYGPHLSEAELESAYRRHFQLATAVGSTGAAWRVILLPGANRVFSLREVLAACYALEYGHWHRFRLLSNVIAKRLLHHLTQGARGCRRFIAKLRP
ncbi:hypothetical protein ABH935_010038 [Catenulispora sp. GAS73]|uniref:hypothetical protein n=1 Tax=Catenulispora sp. GAS73 TaxID=3156269 RepID=UPI003511A460